METKLSRPSLIASANLGNFLSGMETQYFYRAPALPAHLGNFLSGMETDVTEDEDVGTGALGNFLSGMETRLIDQRRPQQNALETSLVEWKQIKELI